ncbi:hypothetical protein RVF83_22565 [Gordonia rubripertincta]|uniref:Ribosomally synthesized peptide with SipW-like signal peptide n=2 Tax=Gordonia rubripertincta TaxID=36822 RepID=A0AAW6R546_GORRU|nr:hypothetical protein [Gordonia rubripertincta]MDG6779420.1 hypothetical protein [Gordonia rubripertincta]NKY62729.1 hypothetical protein [Gordonia rubripertincta]GAB85885.1 hypothetical protein GORBP_065_02160 [Gordonia rubripertincta NBRC 101908]
MTRLTWSSGASRRLRALLTCGILLTTATIGTTALWTTSAATTSGTFTTANVEIKANGSASYLFAFPGSLLPGDTTAFVINVQNTGSVSFHYNSKVSSATALGQAMLLKVVAGGSVSGSTCVPGANGIQVADNVPITGNPVAFSTGRGPLAATSGSEALCLQLTLPTTAAGNLAGTGGSVTFTFDTTVP